MLKRKFQLTVVADFLPGVLKKLPQVVVDKQGAAQNAYDLDHGSVQMQVVLDDGDVAENSQFVRRHTSLHAFLCRFWFGCKDANFKSQTRQRTH